MAKPVIKGTAIELKSKKNQKTHFGIVGDNMKKGDPVVVEQTSGLKTGRWKGSVEKEKDGMCKVMVETTIAPTDSPDSTGDLGEISITVTNTDGATTQPDIPAIFEL